MHPYICKQNYVKIYSTEQNKVIEISCTEFFLFFTSNILSPLPFCNSEGTCRARSLRHSEKGSAHCTSDSLRPKHIHTHTHTHTHTHIYTYLLTPWSRVLLEKLTGSAASQEIPRILWNPKVH